MASFEPKTTIYLCATGIDDTNKPYFESNSAMASWVQGKAKLTFSNYSYQRGDERQYCAVNASYDDCIACDTILYRNDSDMWVIGNITGCEFKNPNCTWVYFKIDAFCTFCGNINWSNSYCMVEREHVTSDWNGNDPNWDNIGILESIASSPSYVRQVSSREFPVDTYIVLDPYVSGSGDMDFTETKVTNGIYSGLNMHIYSNPSNVTSYLNDLAKSPDKTIDNVVGVISTSGSFLWGTEEETLDSPKGWLALRTRWVNAKTFSSPFCVAQLESMPTSTQTYKPECMSAGTNFTINFRGLANGAMGGIVAYPDQYGGQVYNGEEMFGVTIDGLPEGAWVGNTYAEWMATTGRLHAAKVIGSAISGAMEGAQQGAIAGGKGMAAGAIAGAVQNAGGQAYSFMQEWARATKASVTVNGATNGSSINLSVGLNGFIFYVKWITCTDSEMDAVDNYFSIYGYKVMKLKVPNRNTRPFWNYVKCQAGHVDCEAPITYVRQIESMLEHGVTFWNVSAREIGNYSNPAGNAG